MEHQWDSIYNNILAMRMRVLELGR